MQILAFLKVFLPNINVVSEKALARNNSNARKMKISFWRFANGPV